MRNNNKKTSTPITTGLNGEDEPADGFAKKATATIEKVAKKIRLMTCVVI